MLIFGKIVLVKDICAGVIRRVDVDHLDLAEICFLEQFEGVKIVALDIEVFCGVEIDRFLAAWAKRFRYRRIRCQQRYHWTFQPSKARVERGPSTFSTPAHLRTGDRTRLMFTSTVQ